MNSRDIRAKQSVARLKRKPASTLHNILTCRFYFTELKFAVIHSFASADTESLFRSRLVKRFRTIERVARRKLLQIHAAVDLDSLRIPPGNRLEALRGDRKGQHSILINDQWRVCFAWHVDGAYHVEIVDYHLRKDHG